jgi:hypothetical protein
VRWSKLKTAIENRFAPAVIGRVELRATRYRQAHDDEGRGWITVDKKEMWNLCTFRYWRALYETKEKIEADQTVSVWEAYRLGAAEAEKQGTFSLERFCDTLEEYCNLSFVQALDSQNVLIQTLAMLDKRMGKRRLRTLHLDSNTHPMVRYFYEFRLKAEGIDRDV